MNLTKDEISDLKGHIHHAIESALQLYKAEQAYQHAQGALEMFLHKLQFRRETPTPECV